MQAKTSFFLVLVLLFRLHLYAMECVAWQEKHKTELPELLARLAKKEPEVVDHITPGGRKVLAQFPEEIKCHIASYLVSQPFVPKILQKLKLPCIEFQFGSPELIAMSPDGKTAVIYDCDHLKVFDVKQNAVSPICTIDWNDDDDEDADCHKILFSPVKNRFLTLSKDNDCSLLCLRSLENVDKFYYNFKILNNSLIPDIFSPDGRSFVTIGKTGKKVKIRSLETGKWYSCLLGKKVKAAWFSEKDDNNVYIECDRSDKYKLKVFDVKKSIPILTVTGPPSTKCHVDFAQNKLVAVSADEEDDLLFTIYNGKRDLVQEKWDISEQDPAFTLYNDAIIKEIRLSPDGANVVIIEEDYTLKIWRVQTGKLISVIKSHKIKESPLYFSPDGTKILTPKWDEKIWDINTGLCIWYADNIKNLEISKSWNKIAAIGECNKLYFWDLSTLLSFENFLKNAPLENAILLSDISCAMQNNTKYKLSPKEKETLDSFHPYVSENFKQFVFTSRTKLGKPKKLKKLFSHLWKKK